MSEQRHPGDANTGSILRSDRQRDHDLGHPSLVDCDGDALGPGEACGRGPAERACPGCGWRTRDVEREGHVCLTPAQPPAAPETDVRLTDALHRAFHDHWGGPNEPLDLYADSPLWQKQAEAIERIVAERVRVVEGERETLAEQYAAEVEELEADVIAEETRANENATLVHRERARAESAEAAHEALRKGIGALADEWERETRTCDGMTPSAFAPDLRALLAGGEER